MDNGILIVCFDINSKQEENQVIKEENSEKLMENPNRIFNAFLSNHKKLTQYEKSQINVSELNYKFVLKLKEETLFQIRIINDLSFIHDISLNANAYLIFMNLEAQKAREKLENLIKYMLESCCSVDIKTYIIGMYKDYILEKFNKEKIENLTGENYLNCEYFEIKYNDNENHFCLYEFILNKNYGDKKLYPKKIEEFKFYEILEKIIIETYENKEEVKFNPIKRKFVDISKAGRGEGDIAMSGAGCNIL